MQMIKLSTNKKVGIKLDEDNGKKSFLKHDTFGVLSMNIFVSNLFLIIELKPEDLKDWTPCPYLL